MTVHTARSERTRLSSWPPVNGRCLIGSLDRMLTMDVNRIDE
jgi:hypothetical protein